MTYETILGRMLDRAPDHVDKREGSILYDALAPAAAELAKAYMELDVVMDETFVDTASLQYLMLRCKERGVAIQSETAAAVRGVFTPPALDVAVGTRFNCDDINYVVTEKLSDGAYRLEAETLGTAGNQYSGALIPIENVAGLESARIDGVLIPGEDGDTTDTLRAKYYASIDGEAFGGNVADYKEKVNALPGGGGVKVYPAWKGGGTVKLTIIASDHTPPSAELIRSVQTAVDPEENHGEGLGIAPIGHTVTVTGVQAQPVTIGTKITFLTGWSWEDAKSQVEAAVNGYLTELAEQWAAAEATVVRIAQIETRILALSCVLDITDTAINGEAQNWQMARDCIPVLGEIGVIV